MSSCKTKYLLIVLCLVQTGCLGSSGGGSPQKRSQNAVSSDDSTHPIVIPVATIGPTQIPYVTPTPSPSPTVNPSPIPTVIAVAKISIGSSTQVFADDFIIDNSKTYNLLREMQTLSRYSNGPILQSGSALEGNYIVPTYSPIIRNTSGVYQMWYRSAFVPETYHFYATSLDGFNWTRPNLGLVNVGGSTNNNIVNVIPASVILPSGNSTLVRGPNSVMYDPYDTDPSRRYKSASHRYSDVGIDSDLRFSPDGLTWTAYSQNPVMMGVAGQESLGEDQFLFGKDLRINQYVNYIRPHYPKFFGCNGPYGIKRQIGRATSPDGIHNWSQVDTILVPDAQDGTDQFYYMTVYHPQNDVYWGILDTLRVDSQRCDTFQIGAVGRDNTSYLQLVFSRDGIHWSRMGNRAPFLPLSPADSWDSYENWAAAPILVGNNIHVYYGGSNVHHTNEWYGRVGSVYGGILRQGHIGLATLPKDRFIKMRASGALGELETKPFRFSGNHLYVNYSANSGGSLKIELQDLS